MNRVFPSFDTILQDLRYSARTLRRDVGFAIFTVLIISLGIGASATVYSVLNSVLARPLPFKSQESLVWIANRNADDEDVSGQTVQVGRLLDFRERTKSFADVAGYFAFYGVGDVKLTGQSEPERLSAVPVSQGFFPLLGITPLLGRQFSADECKWNGPKAALLSYGFWKRHFAGDGQIVGKAITLDNSPVTVVGVLPQSFDFGSIFAPGARIDLFYSFPLSNETDRWGNTLALVGRLKPGVSLQAAQAESDVLGAKISDDHPHQNHFHPKLTPLREHVTGKFRPALLILGFAVLVVMLIVCANLSNLMLARTSARQKEMAIRAALGAGRGRLISQLLTESMALTSCGSLLGLLLAFLATRGIAHLTAFNLPLLSSVKLDARALLFTILLTAAAGILLGVAPALQVSLLKLNASLSQRGASNNARHGLLRSTLVVSEIAFACVLLVGAGLLLRSFMQVLEVQMGFRPESAASIRIDPSGSYAGPAKRNSYLNEALTRVREIPGVIAAGLTDTLPLGKNRSWGVGAKGRSYTPNDYPEDAFVRVVTDGYLRAMGMSLKQGRDLTSHDTAESEPVVLINESMARNLWPGKNAIDKQIVRACGVDRRVVGVVGDVRHMALEKSSGSEMYLPMRQCQDYGAWELVVRSTLPMPVLSSNVEASLRPIAPDLPKKSMRPLEDLVDRAVSPRRFIVMLLTGFAGFALILASLGIYALISYSVNLRTQEIGIRMALGASTREVQGQIVLRTLGLAGIGMLLGVFASWSLTRALSALLFGITPGDPLTFCGAVLLLMLIAVLAGYLPARRASKIDPMICLRAD